MIVTVVCDVLGKENNGTTVATMNLIRYLKSKGHIVRILCSDQDKREEENVFIVKNYDFGKFINRYVEKVGVTLAKPDTEIIKQALLGCDIVHIMTPLSLGIATGKIAKEMNIPITAGFHMQAENLTSYLKLNKLAPINKLVYRIIYKHLYCYVNRVHYPTNFIKNIFEKNIKCENKPKAYVISNGVHSYVQKREQAKPKELEDKIVILSIGRLAREKSQDTLLKAVNYSKHKDKIQVILAGQGVKENYYTPLGKKLINKPIIKLFERNEVVDILNMCDLYVHPAEIELEGIACLEAIACGKLTIASNSNLSATKEFACDNKCIFENRSPKSLAEVIDYWIEHKTEKKLCEEKYLNSAFSMQQDECMKKMEQMMFEVINENNTKEN